MFSIYSNCIGIQRIPNFGLRFLSSLPNHYEILGLPTNATQKDIKKRYRELSKKYHPDLNNSLSESEMKQNNENFIKVTRSYEVLSDKVMKKKFDSQNSVNITREQEINRQEFHKKYYGTRNVNKPSGLNSSRNRVHYSNSNNKSSNFKTIFTGEYRDYAVNDVPHFDYEKHLQKNINVDKRYTENHSFKNNDYANQFLRTHSNNIKHMRNSAMYASRDYQNPDESNNKIPILITSMLAITILVSLLKSNNEPDTNQKDPVDQTRQSNLTYSYNQSNSKKKLPFSEYVK